MERVEQIKEEAGDLIYQLILFDSSHPRLSSTRWKSEHLPCCCRMQGGLIGIQDCTSHYSLNRKWWKPNISSVLPFKGCDPPQVDETEPASAVDINVAGDFLRAKKTLKVYSQIGLSFLKLF